MSSVISSTRRSGWCEFQAAPKRSLKLSTKVGSGPPRWRPARRASRPWLLL
jgi:hypothetical protein